MSWRILMSAAPHCCYLKDGLPAQALAEPQLHYPCFHPEALQLRFPRIPTEDRMPRQTSPPMHTMMNYPLTLISVLERAGTYFGGVEVISRLPDKSIHRSNWGEVYKRSRQLAECLQS